jgi:hypothetical protein
MYLRKTAKGSRMYTDLFHTDYDAHMARLGPYVVNAPEVRTFVEVQRP